MYLVWLPALSFSYSAVYYLQKNSIGLFAGTWAVTVTGKTDHQSLAVSRGPCCSSWPSSSRLAFASVTTLSGCCLSKFQLRRVQSCAIPSPNRQVIGKSDFFWSDNRSDDYKFFMTNSSSSQALASPTHSRTYSSATHQLLNNAHPSEDFYSTGSIGQVGGGYAMDELGQHSEHYIYVTYPPELKRRLLERYGREIYLMFLKDPWFVLVEMTIFIIFIISYCPVVE